MTSGYPEFRRKLDAVLRQRDPQVLRAFLIAEGQWDADTTTNPERAMWMMIATSPALAALRDEAIAWLGTHGYAEEARTLSGGGRGGGASGGRPPGGRPPHISGGRRPGGGGTDPHGGRGHGRPPDGRPNNDRPNNDRPNNDRPPGGPRNRGG